MEEQLERRLGGQSHFFDVTVWCAHVRKLRPLPIQGRPVAIDGAARVARIRDPDGQKPSRRYQSLIPCLSSSGRRTTAGNGNGFTERPSGGVERNVDRHR